MYSLSEYGHMIADSVRMDAYARALKAAVGPDSVVLDIGAGAGIHALLACKFGARRVFAVEPGEVIHLARALAQSNGFDDRIDFIQDFSTHVSLPEPADVIVADLRGALPLFANHLPSLMDARRRHLKPGGLLIPRRDTMWAALVDSRYLYRELVGPWERPYSLPMEPAKAIVLNSWSDSHTDSIGPGDLLTEPQAWASLDYLAIESPNVARSDLAARATRAGTAHGWLIWFDAEIAAGIGFANGPQTLRPAEVYGRGFFPLLAPVAVAAGDLISLDIRADLVAGQYDWRWHTQIQDQGVSGRIKADFKQSTAYGGALEVARLAQQASSCRPTLAVEGEIARFVLEQMNGQATLAEIASRTYTRFQTHFPDKQAALNAVYELAQDYRQ